MSIIHAFAKLGLLLQCPSVPCSVRARSFGSIHRSVLRSVDRPIDRTLLHRGDCFSRNDHTPARVRSIIVLVHLLFIFHALPFLSSPENECRRDAVQLMSRDIERFSRNNSVGLSVINNTRSATTKDTKCTLMCVRQLKLKFPRKLVRGHEFKPVGLNALQ